MFSCIKKELEDIKNKDFVQGFVIQCKQLGYDIGFLLLSIGVDEHKTQKLLVAEEPHPVNALRFYQENFGTINSFLTECITMWEKDVGTELVIESMKRALKRHKMWAYAEGILKDWTNRNVRSLTDVTGLDQEFASRREKNKNKTRKAESITGNHVGWVRRNST